MDRPVLTVEAALRRIRYDAASGMTFDHQGRRVGSICICGKMRYRMIWMGPYGRFYEHRLALFLSHGAWPLITDHINHDTLDNRLVNLRSGTSAQNRWNTRRSVQAGVYRQGNAWVCDLTHDHVRIRRVFGSFAVAIATRLEWERMYYQW